MTSIASPNKAFYLILLTFTFATSLLFGLLIKMAPLTFIHTLYLCQKTISDLMITIPHSFPSTLALAVGIIVSLGIGLFLLQFYTTQRFIKRSLSSRVKLPTKVRKIASQLGILNQIDLVTSSYFSSFCYGFIKPRICIGSSTVKNLSTGELKAILIHETYHLKNRDPLKIFLSQVASNMFFFIPIIKDIKNYYVLSKELAADQLVVRSHSVRSLHQALIKVLNVQPKFTGVASFANSNDLEHRILSLTKNKKTPIRFSLFNLTISLLVFLMAFVIVSLPVYAMENNNDSHTYFICPLGGECAMSCKQEGMVEEKPFSESRNFSPMNYSSKLTP